MTQDLIAEIKNTPVIILAGGYGTRLAEETHLLPKPMVDLRGLPIIVHIMDFYAQFGVSEFIICGGYKIEVLKNYFVNLPLVGQDVEVQFSSHAQPTITTQQSKYHHARRPNWKVTILETGLDAMTGSRLRKAAAYVKEHGFKRFFATYGDGLTDADLRDEFNFHMSHGKIGTVLGVHQPTRFGILQYDADNAVTSFSEKPMMLEEYINGGYFIFETDFLKYLPENDEDCVLEKTPLEKLAKDKQLRMFPHSGFWQCMDTLREKAILEHLIDTNEAPWKKPLKNM